MKRVAAVLAVALGVALPVVWLVLASLRPEAELFAGRILPRGLTFEHYRVVFGERGLMQPLGSSLAVAGLTTALCVVIGTSAAYALGRLRFSARRVVLGLLLAVSLFPPVALVSPLFVVLRDLRLLDTTLGLVLPYVSFALPLCVWLLTGFFRELPTALEDAARLDGASRWQAFRWVLLPLLMPGIAAAAIVTFVFCWNEFLFASAFTFTSEHQTLPVALALLRGRHQVPWGQVLAASVVATLPVVLVVLSLERRITRALTGGT